MKKFQFLLLDTGPIIKLFELGLWEQFTRRCQVTISRTIMDIEALFVEREGFRDYINLNTFEKKGSISVADVPTSSVQNLLKKTAKLQDVQIDDGEKEILAYLLDSDQNYYICSADAAAYRVLGYLQLGEMGVSFEEALEQIGIKRPLEWKYKKEFREKYTKKGEADFIQRNF